MDSYDPTGVDTLASSGWEAVVNASAEPTCRSYSRNFHEESANAHERGEPERAHWLDVLFEVTSPFLQEGRANVDSPFGAAAIIDGRRTPLPEDLKDDDLAALEQFTPLIGDPELRARVADVVWFRKKRYQIALLAIPAYLESALRLEQERVWHCIDRRLERALRLASMLRADVLVDSVVDCIQDMLDRYDIAADVGVRAAYLLRLLLEFRHGDPVQHADLAKRLARARSSKNDWEQARTYWEIQAEWLARAADDDGAKTARIAAAATFERAAQNELAREEPQHFLVSHQFEEAVKAYRRLGEREHAGRLHLRLLKSQCIAASKMQGFSISVEIGEATRELTTQAVTRSAGKGIIDQVLLLAASGESPSFADLDQNAEVQAAQFVFQALIPVDLTNDAGRTTGTRTSRNDEDPKRAALAKRADMLRDAGLHQELFASAIVESLRDQINADHVVSEDDLLPILVDNPFVPADRISLVARGLVAGFKGDWVVACHLLIPQVENGIRYMLNAHGVVTTSLDDATGVQDEHNLNTLLEHNETGALLGEDLRFDLQGLLVERFGANVRNRMSHGLMTADSFDSLKARYLWWLVLRLCCLSMLNELAEEDPLTLGVSDSNDEARKPHLPSDAPSLGIRDEKLRICRR